MQKNRLLLFLVMLIFLALFNNIGLASYTIDIGNSGRDIIGGAATLVLEPDRDEYKAGDVVELKIKTFGNFEFKEWRGDLSGSENPRKISIDGDVEVGAIVELASVREIEQEMVLVEAGEKAGITIEEDYMISNLEVTQAEFEDLMGFNPATWRNLEQSLDSFSDSNRPVETVSWYDALKYANRLSEAEGLEKYYNLDLIEKNYAGNIIKAEVSENEAANGYRLPTLEEHIYASAGGILGEATLYPGSSQANEVAWYMLNVGDQDNDRTMPVGQFKPNELGLYDMAGNVYNWTNTDDYSRRFARGGSYMVFIDFIEVDNPGMSRRKFRARPYIGFRLVKNAD